MFAVNLEESRRDCIKFLEKKVPGRDLDNACYEVSALDQIMEIFKSRRFLEDPELKRMTEQILSSYKEKDSSLGFQEMVGFVNDVADTIKDASDTEYDLIYMQ